MLQFQVNSFTLSLPDVSPIGVAISPVVAMANHSCEPNAVVVFPNGGRSMEVIAIRDIEPDEEVRLAYPDRQEK
jgi:SET domain-containing protein